MPQPPEGKRLSSNRSQYIVTPRRATGLATLGLQPLSLNVVEQALRASPDVEVVEVLGPTGVLGALADGMPGVPNVIVAKMATQTAEILKQQGQGHLIVEEDQPLRLHGTSVVEPSMMMGSVANAPTLTVTIVVLGSNNAPEPNAEVYLYGSLLPAMGITNDQGQATLSLVGETVQSVRAVHVKPKADYWSFYQSRPALDPTQPNIVVLTPLSETYPNFPAQQMMGWGQRAMGVDKLPPDYKGQGVKVAIVDSGAATTHQNLKSINNGLDIIEKATNPNNWTVDTIAHGSHCAGVIAGHADGKSGILGCAPAAEIHVCKIFPGGQISQLIDALEYCIEKQIDIVNLSLGTDQPSETLEQQLIRVKNLGIACIVAAGNSGGRVQYPASSPNVLAVSAVGKLGEFPANSYHAQTVQGPTPDGYFSPSFTCFGPEIGVCAPGVAILSSVPPNNFAVWDGTSMAAPHVTGLAALVLAHHPDFQGAFKARSVQRVDRLFQIIKASARWINLDDPRRTGFGVPDAPIALGLQPPVTGPHQIAPQGFLGNLLGQVGQPLGGAIGSAFGNQGLGSQLGGAVGQLGRFLPFSVDPLAAALAQQGQLAPQGFFGNLLGQAGQPLGGAIGGVFGNQGLGNQIGGAAGQLGRFLPFNLDPMTAGYAQMQLMPQSFVGFPSWGWWSR